MKTTVRIKKKGQITIPKDIRKALNLNTGDLVELDIVRKVEQ